MKKVYSFLLFVSILTTIGTLAMQPPRPALYYVLDPLVARPLHIDWYAVFGMLDKMEGTLSINAYRTPKGLSLLYLTILSRNLIAAKKLLEEYHADPNALNQGSLPLLIAAISHQDLPMIQLLLKYGADLYAEDHSGRNSLNYAYASDNSTIQQLLESYIEYRNPQQ